MNNIKKIRKSQNISVTELAQKIGMSQANLTKIENNQLEPKIELIDKIAKVLNTSREVLLNTSYSNNNYIEIINPEVYNLPLYTTYPMYNKNRTTNHLKAYILPDDTMSPLFPKNSIAILDMSNISLSNGIYLIETNNTIQLRRLQTTSNNTLLILTENKSYNQYTAPTKDIKILAKATSVIKETIIE